MLCFDNNNIFITVLFSHYLVSIFPGHVASEASLEPRCCVVQHGRVNLVHV